MTACATSRSSRSATAGLIRFQAGHAGSIPVTRSRVRGRPDQRKVPAALDRLAAVDLVDRQDGRRWPSSSTRAMSAFDLVETWATQVC